jgi:lathosterol oxidase
MDIVLEFFDTFLFDRLYATALPIHPSLSSFDSISTIASSFKGYHDVNGNWSGAFGMGGGEFVRSSWEYQHASQYLSVQPSEYAYMSRWDRDNIYRQSLSFWILVWYVWNYRRHSARH